MNEWVWRDRWYRQQRQLQSLPRWDDPHNTVSFETRYSAALAYLHLLEDPLYFANLYLNPGKGGWGQDSETISLEIFAQYTQLHTTGTGLLMHTVASVYGAPVTTELYDARMSNMALDGPIPTTQLGAAGVVVPATKLLFSDRQHLDKALKPLSEEGRGWTVESLQETTRNPADTALSVNKANGNICTICYRADGHYVVVDQVTGEIILTSNTYDPGWIDPLNEVVRQRP